MKANKQRSIKAAPMNSPQKQQPITRFMQHKQPQVIVVSSDHEDGNNASHARSSITSPMNGRRRRIIDSDDDGLDLTMAPAPTRSQIASHNAQAPPGRIDSDHEDTDGNFAVILREPDVGQLPPSTRHKTPPRQVEMRRPTRSQSKKRGRAVQPVHVRAAQSVVYRIGHTF